ncbi:hypothetical protein [Fictibacillus sp. NRS-1165]|uniref:hypothetical protein n=1 Tax=Fictibacillus sp. NRS-1165 TaxID=3144463 RepID=UPI003D20304A
MSFRHNNINVGSEEVFEIGANCLLVLGNRFFAVVEIESEVPGVDLEVFVIIRIDERTARRLNRAGLELCEIRNSIPRSRNRENVEFKCVFINRNQAFALFDVENDFDNAVFVRISMQEAQRLIRQGAQQCTVIDARNNNC